MRGIKFLFIVLTILSALVGLIAFALAFRSMMDGSVNGKSLIFFIIGAMSYLIVGINIGLLIRMKNLF